MTVGELLNSIEFEDTEISINEFQVEQKYTGLKYKIMIGNVNPSHRTRIKIIIGKDIFTIVLKKSGDTYTIKEWLPSKASAKKALKDLKIYEDFAIAISDLIEYVSSIECPTTQSLGRGLTNEEQQYVKDTIYKRYKEGIYTVK